MAPFGLNDTLLLAVSIREKPPGGSLKALIIGLLSQPHPQDQDDSDRYKKKNDGIEGIRA